MSKRLFWCSIFLSICTHADDTARVIIGPALKYGPNGFKTQGVSSSSVTNKKHTTINNTNLVETTYQVVPGFSIQSVPDVFGASIGGSYFNDGTVTLTIGVGL